MKKTDNINKPILLLEAGAEGGSIKLVKMNKHFAYSTDESTLYDLLNETDREGMVFNSQSELFSSFEEALKSALKKYPIFNLYPLFIRQNYKEVVSDQFQKYLEENGQQTHLMEKWRNLLSEQNDTCFEWSDWQSKRVQAWEDEYLNKDSLFDKMNLLIAIFLKFHQEDPFGMFDEMVVLEEDEILQREETMEFLSQKFTEIQELIKNT